MANYREVNRWRKCEFEIHACFTPKFFFVSWETADYFTLEDTKSV